MLHTVHSDIINTVPSDVCVGVFPGLGELSNGSRLGLSAGVHVQVEVLQRRGGSGGAEGGGGLQGGD